MFARSIRKEEAKMRTVMLPYRSVYISFVVGRKNILKDAVVKDPLRSIWENREKYTAYVSLLQCIRHYIPTNALVDEPLYATVIETLSHLKACKPSSASIVSLVAKTIILSHLGHVEHTNFSVKNFTEVVDKALQSKTYKNKIEKTLMNAMIHY